MAFEALDVEIPDTPETGSRFHRWLAVAVAAVTLFGALVVLLEQRASVRSEKASRETQRSAAEGVSANALQQASGTFAMGTWADARAVLRQKALDNVDASQDRGTVAGDVASARTGLWDPVAGTFGASSPLLSKPEYTIDADPTFPGRFTADSGVQSDVVDLRQQAYADAATAFGNKAGRFGGVITLLAVVLFLLGLSLTVPARVRPVLLVPTVLIGLWCLGSTVQTSFKKVHQPSETAISSVAEADRLANRLELQPAIDKYTEAIKMEPAYALAYGRRAKAEFEQGAHIVPGQSFFSFTDPEHIKVGIADAQKAVDLGAGNDVTTVNTLGALLFHAKRFDDAIAVFDHVIDLNEENPLGWLNLATAEMADGRDDDASDSFSTAIEKVNARPDSSERRSLYTTVLGVLDEVALEVPGRTASVDHFRDVVVQAEMSKEVGPGPAAPGGIAVTGAVTFSGLGATAAFKVPTVDPNTPVAVVWYTRDAPDHPFQAEEGMTLLQRAGQIKDGQLLASGSPAQCAKPGDYRADLYLGGARVASATASRPKPAFGDAVYIFDADLGVELCRPLDWTQATQPGQLVVLTSPDKALQVGVAAIPIPPDSGLDQDGLARLAIDASAAGGTVSNEAKATVGGVPGYQAVVTAPDGSRFFVAAAALSTTDVRAVRVGPLKPNTPILDDIYSTLFFFPGTG